LPLRLLPCLLQQAVGNIDGGLHMGVWVPLNERS
jgi:hypothetical protein